MVHPIVVEAIEFIQDQHAVEIWWTKPSLSRGQGTAGDPDFLILINGVLIGIECKWDMWINHGYPNQRLSTNKNNLPTAPQTSRLRLIKKCGGLGLVADRHNVKQIMLILGLVIVGRDVTEQIKLDKLDIEYYASNLKELTV